MNKPNTPSTEHPQHAPQGTSALVRLLFVAAILLAAGLATIPFERGSSAPPVGDHVVAPTVSMLAAPATGTSVPPASEVFAGRDVATEPAPPTF
jgi:hypothetical protein